ncbi:phage late control D family protein, partial [Micromonospora deserti]
MTAPRALTVLVDGVPLPDAATRRLVSARVAGRLDQPTQCEVALTTAPGAGALTPPVRAGAALEVRLDGHPEALFAGEVTCVEVEYAADGAALLRVRGYDALHRLRKRQRLRVLESVTAADLARELCADLGWTVVAEADGPRLDRLAQHRHSDLELLCEVTGRAGLHLAADGDRLRLVTLEGYGEPVELALGRDVHSLRLSTNLDAAAGGSSALGWHPQRAEPIRQQAATPRSGRRIAGDPDPADVGADGARTAVDQPGRSDDELAALAQARLDARVAALVTAEGVAAGDPVLRPGRRVALTGVPAAVQGAYVLTEVVHTVDGNGHLTRFSTAPP